MDNELLYKYDMNKRIGTLFKLIIGFLLGIAIYGFLYVSIMISIDNICLIIISSVIYIGLIGFCIIMIIFEILDSLNVRIGICDDKLVYYDYLKRKRAYDFSDIFIVEFSNNGEERIDIYFPDIENIHLWYKEMTNGSTFKKQLIKAASKKVGNEELVAKNAFILLRRTVMVILAGSTGLLWYSIIM